MNMRAPGVGGPGGPNIRGPMGAGIREVGPASLRPPGPMGPPFRGRSGDWATGPPPPQQQWDRPNRMGPDEGSGWSGGEGGGGGEGAGPRDGGNQWNAPNKRMMHNMPPPGGQDQNWSAPRPGGSMMSPGGDHPPHQGGGPPFVRPPMVNLHRPPPASPGMIGAPRPPLGHPPPSSHMPGPRHPSMPGGGVEGAAGKRPPPPLGRGLSGRLGAPPNLSKPPPNLNKPPPASHTQGDVKKSLPPPATSPKPVNKPAGEERSNSEAPPSANVSTRDLLQDIDDLSDFSDDTDDLLNQDGGAVITEDHPTPSAEKKKSPVRPTTVDSNVAGATTPTTITESPSLAAAVLAGSNNDTFEEEETMDLEEISDDDLEDERQAKFNVCDALTINWSALAPSSHKSQTTTPSVGGVMSKFSTAAILSRIGVSTKYARSDVISGVLTKCSAVPGLGLHNVPFKDESIENGDSKTTMSDENRRVVEANDQRDIKIEEMEDDETTEETDETKNEVSQESALSSDERKKKVVVPAVVCNTGVVTLLKFKPLHLNSDARISGHPCETADDEKTLKKEVKLDTEAVNFLPSPSEEILQFDANSVALSAQRDINIRLVVIFFLE